MSILTAYFLFKHGIFLKFVTDLNLHGYAAALIAGFLFAYGFTAPLAVGLFLSIPQDTNIFFIAILGGFTAFIADYLIFKFIKTSFHDEFERLKLTNFFQKFINLFNHHFSYKIQKYIVWTFAGLMIASPLPDEFGISILSGFTDIDKKTFSVISFVLNTFGIFIILLLTRI